MNRIIASLFASALLATTASAEASSSEASSSGTCTTEDTRDACFSGQCSPYLGPPPTYADDVCCDDRSGTCMEPGPRGCTRGQTPYYCDYGQVDAATGQVECFFETYEVTPGGPVPAADDEALCCNDNGCTVWVVGCEDGGGWVGYCYGDELIMEDGTVHCYNEEC
ncbi:MAG: hypothetical protein AAF799_47995 [Myxococcota bacterium]